MGPARQWLGLPSQQLTGSTRSTGARGARWQQPWGVAPGRPRWRPAPELRRRALRGGESAGEARIFATEHQITRFHLRSNADAVARRVVPLDRPEMAGTGSCKVAGVGGLR